MAKPREIVLTESMLYVDAPHMVCLLIFHGERCAMAPPIMGWAIGRDREELMAYFAEKAWKAMEIDREGKPVTGA